MRKKFKMQKTPKAINDRLYKVEIYSSYKKSLISNCLRKLVMNIMDSFISSFKNAEPNNRCLRTSVYEYPRIKGSHYFFIRRAKWLKANFFFCQRVKYWAIVVLMVREVNFLVMAEKSELSLHITYIIYDLEVPYYTHNDKTH